MDTKPIKKTKTNKYPTNKCSLNKIKAATSLKTKQKSSGHVNINHNSDIGDLSIEKR